MALEVPYIAGFFDGEGCVGFARVRGSIFPRIMVVNTNKSILEELQSQFGGDIKAAHKKAAWKQAWQWRLQWSKAVQFLELIYPYLRVKKAQSEAVFAWASLRNGSRSQRDQVQISTEESLVIEMHRLNKRGVDPAFAVME